MKKFTAAFRKNPIAVVSIGLFIIMSLFVPKFFTARNLPNLFAQISYIGIPAVGIAYVFISGGNDMSTGMAMSLSGMISCLVMSYFMKNEVLSADPAMVGLAVALGVIVVIACGVLCGAINGFFVAKLKVNSFMMTLITQLIFKSVALIPTQSKSISAIPDAFVAIGKTKVFNLIPVSVFLLIAFFVAGQIFLSKSGYARRLFATGANPKAAQLVGVNTFAVQFKAYLFLGFCNAVGAIILVGKLGVANPAMGNDLFLDIMCGAIIGGCSLQGGKGSVTGTAFGVLLMGLITNGLTLLGVPYQGTTVVKGVVILGAIIFNTLLDRTAAKKMLASASQKQPQQPAPAAE